MKQPKHCKHCKHWHRAGHKEGTRLHGSKYDNWCTRFSKGANRAVGVCKLKKGNC